MKNVRYRRYDLSFKAFIIVVVTTFFLRIFCKFESAKKKKTINPIFSFLDLNFH